MNSSLTAKLYTIVAGIMSIYKRYPKREDYDRVARSLVAKYPFLRSPISGHISIKYLLLKAGFTFNFISDSYNTSIER